MTARRTPYTYVTSDIWADPVFRSLTRGAHLLWFYRAAGNRASHYSTMIHYCPDASPEEIEEWACELAATPYGIILPIARRQRFTPAFRAKVLDAGGHLCAYCGSTNDLCVDHIRPVALGGTNDLINLQILCRPCNSTKGAKYDAECEMV